MSRLTIKALTLAASLLAAAALSSCGESASSPAATAAPAGDTPSVLDTAEETTTGVMPPVPDGTDYGGYTFTIRNGNIADWMVTYAVDADEENGEALNDAIYKRNLAVEEALNVKITSIDESGARSDAEKAIKAGDDAYDLVLDTTAEAFTMATNGTALSYDNIPSLELDKPWWVQSSLRDTSIAGHVYYAISLFDTTHYCEIRGLMFNKTLRESYQLDNPYDLVNDNKWTLDKMKEMGVTVALDLDGDGKWTKADQYGYTSWSRVGCEALVYGAGGKLSLNKDEDDYPFFDLDDVFYYDRYSAVAALYAEEGFKAPQGDSSNHGGLDEFIEGKILFYNEAIGNAHSLRDMDADFGIIPCPKYNEEQEEYQHFGGTPYVEIIPKTASDPERTGYVLETLAWASQDTVVPAYYEVTLNGKIARDTESSPMLDIVFNTLSYPNQLAFDYCDTKVTDIIWKGKTDFASYFAKNAEKIQKAIDKAVAAYEENN